ncbi:MAG: glycosyltransferase family 2 protein [Acidimicrobiales bacterium]
MDLTAWSLRPPVFDGALVRPLFLVKPHRSPTLGRRRHNGGVYDQGRSPSSARPVVDVVILTWNDPAMLERALDSVLAATEVVPRVIVIDNGSRPAALGFEDPDVVLVRNETNQGVAKARNQGARLGAASLICFLDSDAVLLPQSLGRLAEVVLADERIAVAVPVFAGQKPEASAGRAPTLGRKAFRALRLSDHYDGVEPTAHGAPREVDFGIGACQVVRRSAFNDVGGLDESYFYGPEDVDFCLRLRERGWRVLQVSDASVEHPPRRRNRTLMTRRGARHAWAVCRHLWRHRRFRGMSAR